MFGKKKCNRCNEKISNSYTFCPKCGNHLKTKNDEYGWGMLGKQDDFPEYRSAEIRLPMGFDMLFKSLMKNLDQQFKEIDKEFGNTNQFSNPNQKFPKGMRHGGISINISTSNNKPPEIKVRSTGNIPEFKQREQEIKKQLNSIKDKDVSGKKLERFSKLPQKEPQTNVRRLADKVTYEISLPGVKSIKDVSITKLENSIEIKAVAKDKAYFKLIPINLPIIDYSISKGKLVIELGEES